MGAVEVLPASSSQVPISRIGATRAAAPRSIPVVIVTGFLGSGKTTVVQQMMSAAGSTRLAVIVNEFGSVGIDGALLDGAQDQVIELSNGCMCCENRGDMARAIGNLLTHGPPIDALVIETSGLADPLGVATVIISYDFGDELILSSVATVVDAENFDRNLEHAEAAYQQLVSADVFVIGKADLVNAATTDLIKERLARINSAASAVISDHGRCAYDLLLTPPTAAAVLNRQNDIVGARSDGFESFAWSNDQELNLRGFIRWVEELPEGVCRVKAIVSLNGDAYAVHRVGIRVTVLPLSGPTSGSDTSRAVRVTVIGRGLDPNTLTNQLIALTYQ